MKKIILISTAFIAVGMTYTGNNFANAQESKLSFGFNAGAGIPMGDYAKHDSTASPIASSTVRYSAAHPTGYTANDTTKLNGFAKTGFHFNVYGQYRIAGPIGIKLSIGGTMNSYDAATFSSAYAKIWAENPSNTGVPAPTWTSSKNYYIGEYLIGPCLRLPAGAKLKIEAQVLVGLVTGSYPSLNSGTLSVSGPGYSDSYTETYSTVSSVSAFGYNFSAGFEYKVAPLIGLHLNAGYTGSSFSYANYTVAQTTSQTVFGVTSTNSSTQTYNVAKTMSMGILAITLGLSVDL